MIRVSDINRKKTVVLDKIHQYIDHSYLKKFLKCPKVDEDKLFLLVAMCNDLELKEEIIESYIITTMLVQVALDTHEEVSIATTIHDVEHKEQQLKVLAGDYYSGLYYSLLAELEDIKMIQILATSIKRINEHKIKIYQKDTFDLDSIIESIRIIESDLFRNVAHSHKLSFWRELIPELLLLKRLYYEKMVFEQTGNSLFLQSFVDETVESHYLSNSRHGVERVVLKNFELIINKTYERVQTFSASTEVNTSILNTIHSMINSFEKPRHKIVEEG